MKKFQFRLQAALTLRQRREEQLAVELAQARNRLLREKGQMERLASDREDLLRQSLAGRTGRVDAEELCFRERLFTVMEEQIAEQRHLVIAVEREVESKLQERVEAKKETRALEQLREQSLRAHRLEAQREEQTFLDELASILSARKQREAA